MTITTSQFTGPSRLFWILQDPAIGAHPCAFATTSEVLPVLMPVAVDVIDLKNIPVGLPTIDAADPR